MLDFDMIWQFSRSHCIGVCALLVPVNMIATLQTLIFAARRSSPSQVQLVATFALFYATLLILHVFSWWMVGVVRIPTYILLFLGTVCLGLNTWLIWDRYTLPHLWDTLGAKLRQDPRRRFSPLKS